LQVAFFFWEDLRRCVDEIAEPLEAEELAEDMKVASTLLQQQQQKLRIFPDRSGFSAPNHQQQQQQHQHQQQQLSQQPLLQQQLQKQGMFVGGCPSQRGC